MRAKLILGVCLTLVATLVFGQRTWGSWSYERSSSGDFLYAATVNDSGHLLGQYCFLADGQCVYLLGIRTSCKEGATYPVLVNSNVGSYHMSLLCSGRLDSGSYRYVFSDFDTIDDLVKRASKAGFAIPLANDQFIVVRFDLIGSNEAIAAMKSGADRSRPARQGTRDQRL